ncbi:Protein of unknown function [Pyronema omphalodes CBS 100304]|uniref:Uncharacterized protein n=1 Tax=Pyronema omphalodes (strain CBS 100304) TaxID=1076935 RepID=U4LKT3_PYROM|nr:Protein of unknown function [Pyronema omphalodes CBS 100304]
MPNGTDLLNSSQLRKRSMQAAEF